MLIINKVNPTEDDQQSLTVEVPNPGAKKKVTSQRRIEANRHNALLSTGPRDTQRTRFNAVRHGLLAEGLTQWDDAEEFEETILAFRAIYDLSDPLDAFLITRMALDMLRSRRIAQLEAGSITALSGPPNKSIDPTSDRFTPMIDPIVMKEFGGQILDRFERYNTATLNRLLRCRRELERIPRDKPGQGTPTQTSRTPM
jgi:hypothetical protein